MHTALRHNRSRVLLAPLAALALAAFPSAALAKKHKPKLLLKGTPYAAEVTATVHGTVLLDQMQRAETKGVCEQQSSVSTSEGQFSAAWNARYPQVTVPVAGQPDLGAAFKKLHVNVTPTSDGSGGLQRSSFAIAGKEPATSDGNQGAGGSDCTPIAYSSKGTLSSSPRPTAVTRSVKLFSALESSDLWYFSLGNVDGSAPSRYTLPDGTQGDPASDFQQAASLVPTDAATNNLLPPSEGSVPAHFKISDTRKLVKRKQVSIDIPVYKSSSDCGLPATDIESYDCRITWSYSYRVTLRKRFLYRTKRTYKR
jgi:hypothetical protein